ncbi:MAG: sigma-70 family RNA polymerase sigma factor [Pseudonocardiales bacterium]|jgi:RNA polymerase sigma factor (sigma-70 family)|nr:sigma-70 family RNA polymerase sigma factor [Pseudonocardiales bacterium]
MTVTRPAPRAGTASAADAVRPETPTTDLLRRAGAGDRDAWARLVERFEPVVIAAVVAHRLQPADARDAAQGTWLRMVEHHRDIRDPEALGGWLRTTARRECLRIIRESGRADPLDDAEGAVFRDAAVDVERAVVDADTLRRVRRLVDALPVRSATLVRVLFQDAPPGYAEIARRTGVPVGSIGPTRARALQKLRTLFEAGATGSGCRA